MKGVIRDKRTVEPDFPYLIRSLETGNVYIARPYNKGVCVFAESYLVNLGVGNIVDTSEFAWEVFKGELVLSND